MVVPTRTLTEDRSLGACLVPFLIGWVVRIEHRFKAIGSVGCSRLGSVVELVFRNTGVFFSGHRAAAG